MLTGRRQRLNVRARVTAATTDSLDSRGLEWWGRGRRQAKGTRTAEAVVASDNSTDAGDPQNTSFDRFDAVLHETGAENATAIKLTTNSARGSRGAETQWWDSS